MDSIAVTALVVALIALVTAVGQLLQAYLATADGYRRCQSSVMGGWAKKTRLRWRWSQFRFEALYATPEICMTKDGFVGDGGILILGDETSRPLTVTPRDGIWNAVGQNATIKIARRVREEKAARRQRPMFMGKTSTNPVDELVGWIPMLHRIHETMRASLECESIPNPSVGSLETPDELLIWKRVPAVITQERSWDF